MFDGLFDASEALAEGYAPWIVCSLLLFAILMYKLYPKVYSFHCEQEDYSGNFIEGTDREPIVITDPRKIKLDKILCFLSASFCFLVVSALFTKVVLYILGIILLFFTGILQTVVFAAVCIVAIIILMFIV